MTAICRQIQDNSDLRAIITIPGDFKDSNCLHLYLNYPVFVVLFFTTELFEQTFKQTIPKSDF